MLSVSCHCCSPGLFAVVPSGRLAPATTLQVATMHSALSAVLPVTARRKQFTMCIYMNETFLGTLHSLAGIGQALGTCAFYICLSVRTQFDGFQSQIHNHHVDGHLNLASSGVGHLSRLSSSRHGGYFWGNWALNTALHFDQDL